MERSEFAKSPFDFKTFNEFFYRALKPSARPITPGERVAVFPADGRHLVFPNVETVDGFYVSARQNGATALTATVFCTVIAVIAVVPCTPARANALR